MKIIFTLAICLTISIVKAQLPSDSLMALITLSNIKGIKKGYGTAVDQPIGSGAFANLADMANVRTKIAKFENSFRWPNGATIDFSSRVSTGGKNGIVDCYTLTNPDTKQVIKLFVDPYHTDSVFYIPEGLILVTKAIYANEIAPHLANIDVIDAADDPSTTETSRMNALTQYLSLKVGIAALIDREKLIKIMTDTQADQDLKNHLLSSFVVHRFYALGKNISNSKAYALLKMKADFAKFQKNHPDVNAGNIKINLN
ncbi:hypothetical protein [Pedobacter sandarakinus]|uniref:hypothetical protein n=1 Tax=Pedobacter sandarakinus TaxID=353156 RepID=UPI00224681E1|nr:hypothetical protein [Pedobacter sandarakinus]MCX2573520.1 hypothetical protein [Pedobacter sandarakinus]